METSKDWKHRNQSLLLRDILALVFRRHRLLIGTFLAVAVPLIAWGMLHPTYASEMKFLVRQGRVTPVISSDAVAQVSTAPVTEAELNSEAELLQTKDLLTKAVLTAGLAGAHASDISLANAVRTFQSRLKVQVGRKANIISVQYTDPDPKLAAAALRHLARLYLDKHLAVHRASGEYDFFDQQAKQYEQAMETAQLQLTSFVRDHGIVSAQLERDISLQRLKDFEANTAATETAVAETHERINSLRTQLATTPERVVTAVKTAPNPQLLETMKSTLLQLQLKRNELAAKYTPNYRPLQEVAHDIELVDSSIASEQQSPLHDETTDQNPAYIWMRSELAKNEVELTGLKARAAMLRQTVAQYRKEAGTLDRANYVQQGLLRAVKTDEQNFYLYQKKREEARMNDALDRRGILNVTLAEEPAIPVLPSRSRLGSATLAILFSFAFAFGVAVLRDVTDPIVRTPEQVTDILEAPFLGSIAQERPRKNGVGGNGASPGPRNEVGSTV